MTRKNLTVTVSLILLSLLLGLSSCIYKPEPNESLQALQKENATLKTEIKELKAEVERLKSELGEPSTSETTEKPQTIVTQPTESKTTKASADDEEEFVYDGPLVVDGKKVKDLSRAEQEAMPTIVTEIKNPETGEITKIYPPDDIKNLYEQLRYQAYISEQVGHNSPGDEPRISAPVEVEPYDTRDKALVVALDVENGRKTVYELSGSDDAELIKWLDNNLAEDQRLAEDKAEDFRYNTHLYSSDGREIYFWVEDFTESNSDSARIIQDREGDYYSIPKAETLLIRDLITSNRDETIYDSEEDAAFAERKDGALPLDYRLQVERDAASAKLTIFNKGSELWYYTGSYSVSYFTGGDWLMVQPQFVGDSFETKLRGIMPGEERSFDLDFKSNYGLLPPGFYRMTFSLQTGAETDGNAGQQEIESTFFAICY
ncbi:MAG: bZIP transcription factor [Eubacteriales bacterium]|nr:bZIP transcription factor [Eubacteriales bacterium]